MTPEVWECMALADMARQGTWPLPGGLLDQTKWFIEFCRYLWREQDGTKAKLRIRD